MCRVVYGDGTGFFMQEVAVFSCCFVLVMGCSNVNLQTFLQAEEEIVKLMETDSFKRFKAGPLFQVCVM